MPVSTALPQIRAGRVRALAVLTEKRIPSLPDVPTGIEAGVKDFTMPLWYGMFAPAGTSREHISRLNQEIVRALQSPDVRERLTAMSVEPWPGTAEELGSLLVKEIERYGAVARSAGLPPQLSVTVAAIPRNEMSTGPPSEVPSGRPSEGRPVTTRSKPPSGRIRLIAPVSP